MENQTAANAEWQECGGKLEIPEGWVCTGADFDAEEPWIRISNPLNLQEEILRVPKTLAYYLCIHYCGSDHMHEIITTKAERNIQQKIKDVLGL